jgi:hypothetical protein
MKAQNVKKKFDFYIKWLKTFKNKQTLLHGYYTSIVEKKLGEIMNIQEYANELICIILLQFKEQFMRFHLISVTLFFIN